MSLVTNPKIFLIISFILFYFVLLLHTSKLKAMNMSAAKLMAYDGVSGNHVLGNVV